MDVQIKGSSLKFMRTRGKWLDQKSCFDDFQVVENDFYAFVYAGKPSLTKILKSLAEKTNIPGMEQYGKGQKVPKGNKLRRIIFKL